MFGILLACQCGQGLAVGEVVAAAEVRESLDTALRSLQEVERTSLMSCKGRQCLQGFLQVYDSLRELTAYLL